MPLTLHAPIDGTLIALGDVPDPVFAEELVGPGLALAPADDATRLDVCAPVGGSIVTIHPHAFVLHSEESIPLLVHLGIDTVELKGAGFTRYADKSAPVKACDPLIGWDLGPARASDHSVVVPIIVLIPAGVSIRMLEDLGTTVKARTPIAEIIITDDSGGPAL